jgi:DNA-binding response OmpR family regulator
MVMIKIAIIEDDATISQMYRIKFENLDYSVQTAENGALGLILIDKFRPDIVLLDLMMPEKDGATMLAELRQTDFGKNLKVIILTNMGETEIPKNVFDLGVKDVILKADMTPRQVAELVSKTLES